MGSWGTESPSNDPTMDVLCGNCENIYKPTQDEADKCLDNWFNTSEYTNSLGLVIWFLHHNLKVAEPYLTNCLFGNFN